MKITRLTFMLGAAALVAAAGPASAQTRLADFSQPALKDFSGSISIISSNQRELQKIGKTFADLYKYRGDKAQFWYKEPGMVRFEGKHGVITARHIVNGDRRASQVPNLRINHVENIAKDPDEAETSLDFGLITPAFANRVQSRFLRTEEHLGKNCAVFEVWYTTDAKRKHTLWLDTRTKTVVDHIDHHRAKRKAGFKKRFVFSDVKQYGAVWVPTKVEVYSPTNKLAGASRYDNLKVNAGLSDNLFRF